MMKKIYWKKEVFFFSLAALIFFTVSAAYAGTKYTIKKGDNLYDIAKKYHLSVQDIKNANNLSSIKLKPGNKIVLPADKKHVRQAKAKNVHEKVLSSSNKTFRNFKTLAENKKTQASSSTDNLVYHTVKKGDSLSSVAREYSISIAEIKEINKMKSARLKNGQRLLVKKTGPRTYTVRKGDNIWKIAKKFDVDAEELMGMNEIESPSLKIGQVLYLEEKTVPEDSGNNKEVLAKNLEEEISKMAQTQESPEKDKPNRLVEFAKKLINIPYKFGGNSIFGIDCSAYVKKVYSLLGVSLPRTAREQFTEGEAVEMANLLVGDLVFFRTYASFPSHVGIYLGNNLFIHASSRGKKVTIDSLETPYYLKRFLGGKRLLKEDGQDSDDKS